jgi:phytanoyl-CoA hydroxylase
MQLTKEQIEQFTEQGYLTVEDFFDSTEIAAIQADVKRLQEEGRLRNVLTIGDGETTSAKEQNLQLCPASPHSELIKSLPFSNKVQEAITSLLGDENVLVQLDQIFLKPGRTGRGTNWHQDNAYFKITGPIRGTAMWIAVDDATRANGTIRVVPSAFNRLLKHERDLSSDHHIACKVDEDDAIILELPAGGVAFFHYETPHATGDNQTDECRAGLAYHFVNLPTDSSNDDRDWASITRPYLTGPNASDGVKEYGKSMSAQWESLFEL